MSMSAGYLACRAALAAHVEAAWSCDVWLGNMRTIPPTANLPIAFIVKSPDAPTAEENISPVTKTSTVPMTIGGVWAEPADGTDLESYALARAEEARALIDADHHLGGEANLCQVSGIDWSLPTGADPNDKRLYVTLSLILNFEYDR